MSSSLLGGKSYKGKVILQKYNTFKHIPRQQGYLITKRMFLK